MGVKKVNSAGEPVSFQHFFVPSRKFCSHCHDSLLPFHNHRHRSGAVGRRQIYRRRQRSGPPHARAPHRHRPH